jgi:hypothetical protein
VGVLLGVIGAGLAVQGMASGNVGELDQQLQRGSASCAHAADLMMKGIAFLLVVVRTIEVMQ